MGEISKDRSVSSISIPDIVDEETEKHGSRRWTSSTFACHRQVSSCALSSCAPCVQFGLNQRLAFGDSCVKWSLAWLLPLLFFGAIYSVLPSASAVVDPAAQAVAEVDAALALAKVDGEARAGWDMHAGHGHHEGKHGGHDGHSHHGAADKIAVADEAAAASMLNVGAMGWEDAASHPVMTHPQRNPILLLCLLTMASVAALSAWRRSKLRHKYGLGGSFFSDCLAHCLCHCCSLAREAREIRTQAVNEVLREALDHEVEEV